MRKYTVKMTPALKAKLKNWWFAYRALEDAHHRRIRRLEKSMEKDTGIKGIEFFFPNTEGCAGIGNYGMWTMPLVHGSDLE